METMSVLLSVYDTESADKPFADFMKLGSLRF